MNLMIGFIKIMHKIQWAIAGPLKWGLFAFMTLIVFEVIMRYAVQLPTVWGLDFRQMMYGVLITLGSAYTLMVKGHVTVDVFLLMMSFRMRKMVNILGWLVFYLPPIGVLAYTQFFQTMYSWRVMEGSGTIWNPPVYPFKTILVIAYVNLVLQGIAELFKDIISLQKGSEDWIRAL